MPDAAAGLIYEFGQLQIDLSRRELLAHGDVVPLGFRAFEVLEVLVLSADTPVTRDALMARVWPGAIVEDNTLQVHISAIRKALGPDRGLLKAVSGRGYRLRGDWTPRGPGGAKRTGDGENAQSPEPPFQSNLPIAAADLFGRTEAMRRLRDLISSFRGVTLTGPGGIGKTRLALEVARDLLPHLHGDCLIVELASLSASDQVCSTVARVLGLELGMTEISPMSVARAIGERRLLLVLDNCEHVIDVAAALAETVLRMCPRVTLLATSREVLGIDGEVSYRVPPLDFPADGSIRSNDVLAHSAVQLFIARAKSSHDGFTVHPADHDVIGAICRRLDGIPLAIELAAARAAVFGAKQVLSLLEDRFGLLTNGRRTALPRHRTLRAAFDWSHDLLPESERCLLRRLAVFTGGFTAEAAAAVTSDTDLLHCMRGLASLGTKSLLVLDESGARTRWRLLETTRAYALERLTDSGEAELIRRRHAAFFRSRFAPAGIASASPPTTEDLANFAHDIDNVRAALDWAFSPNGDTVTGVRLTAALVPFWANMMLFKECRGRVETALTSLGSGSMLDARLSMELYRALGFALILTTELIEKTRFVLAKTFEIAESLDDLHGQLRALWAMWAHQANETREARAIAERFSQIARRGGDPADILVGDRLLGYTTHYMGDQPRARNYLESVVRHYIAPGDQRHLTWFHYDQRVLARAVLARVHWLEGHVKHALQCAHDTLTDARATGHILSQCFALAEAVCPVALSIGDLAAAAQAVEALVDLATECELGLWRNWGRCLEGQLLIRRGEFTTGTIVLRDALDAFARTGRQMRYPAFLGVLAEGLATCGQFIEGMEAANEGLTRAERDGERWCVPELLRVKGELLLRRVDDPVIQEAEDCFLAAIVMAQRQGARSWELRAATSLANLRIRQARWGEARLVLMPAYEWFADGFETEDLRNAKTVLDELLARHANGNDILPDGRRCIK